MKKRLAFLLALAVLALFCVSCSQTPDNTSSDESAPDASETDGSIPEFDLTSLFGESGITLPIDFFDD